MGLRCMYVKNLHFVLMNKFRTMHVQRHQTVATPTLFLFFFFFSYTWNVTRQKNHDTVMVWHIIENNVEQRIKSFAVCIPWCERTPWVTFIGIWWTEDSQLHMILMSQARADPHSWLLNFTVASWKLTGLPASQRFDFKISRVSLKALNGYYSIYLLKHDK